jgi:hypothetical protein
MSNFDHVLLVADTANGVQAVDIMDYPEAETMSANEFHGRLKDLGDGETIYCMIMPKGTDGKWEEIESEYGIH